MSLEQGTRLGPYELLSLVGVGGMGEVYRARDSRLQRIVAIKVIREEVVSSFASKHRFDREAQIVSSLDHPHICTLYDVGCENGSDYLVMEYLEGETLAARLEHGPIPVAELLVIAKQIATALDAAHRAGVIHRDLKPGNIMLTKSGAKLMDFGLAKPSVAVLAHAAGEPSTRTAIRANTTTEGTIVGTVQYIAPEIFRGDAADDRSDIFSFGCILYEMITGRLAFNAPSTVSLIAAILEKDPEPIVQLKPTAPFELTAIVNGCLAKHPEERWQSAADLVHALSWIGAAAPAASKRIRRKYEISLGLAVLACAIAAISWNTWRPANVSPLRRYSIVLPESAPIAPASAMPLGVGRPTMAVSKDGSRLVYVGMAGGTRQLFLRTSDGGPPRALPGTEDAHSPFFSADEKSVAFFAGGKLKRISLDGGPVITLCDAVLGFGGFWNRDGFIYFQADEQLPVYRIAADGGSPTQVTPEIMGLRGPIAQYWPLMLPRGNGLIFANSRFGLEVFDFASSERRRITNSGSYPRWSGTGHVLYVDDGVLWALPFDDRKLKPKGHPILVTDQVQMEQQGAAQFDITQDGTVLFVRGGDANEATLVLVDKAGSTQDLGLPPHRFGEFQLSPDGKQLAVIIRDQLRSDLWTYDIARKVLTRLTDEGYNWGPVWNPEGTRIIYSTRASGDPALIEVAPDGTHRRVIATVPGLFKSTNFTPDRKSMLVVVAEPPLNILYVIDVGSGTKTLVERPRNLLAFPTLSPDGHLLAYVTDQSGRWEVYVRQFSGDEHRWRITTGGGEEPIWDRSGRHIYYRNGDSWMQVEITTTPEFHASEPKQVLKGPYVNIPGYSYDIAPDGRFLLLKSEFQDKKVSQIEVIENWPELLKKNSVH
jgi:serine/threonine-protein kinase